MAADPGEGDFDAVVVGSGAGGGAVAFGLTRAGLRTCVLEKGPQYSEADFTHDELAITRRSFFVPSPFDEPNLVARDGGKAAPSADGWISCCVGGGTVHMMGWMFRMEERALRMKSRVQGEPDAELVDWPIEYDELANAPFTAKMRQSNNETLKRLSLTPGTDVLPDWQLTLDTAGQGYWFMIKDKLDPCGFAYISNQAGLIFRAEPIREDLVRRPCSRSSR